MRLRKKTPVLPVIVHELFFGKEDPDNLLVVGVSAETLIIQKVPRRPEAIFLIDYVFYKIDEPDELYEGIQTFPREIGVSRHHGA